MTTRSFDSFQVIADPSRREILYLLTQDSLSINALAENFEMSRPAVSKHIKILSDAGFISIEDIGRERLCTIRQDGFNEVREWLDYYDTFWASKLKGLGTLMDSREKRNKKAK